MSGNKQKGFERISFQYLVWPSDCSPLEWFCYKRTEGEKMQSYIVIIIKRHHFLFQKILISPRNLQHFYIYNEK